MIAVSVIIPNYNHAPYLKQRIDSVLAQTFQDFEVIILDDCSTDNSKEVIESYAQHPKISHIVFNTTNSGSPFLQWEKGINLAKGKYVWIAESDDWCEPSLLEDLIEGIQKDKDCVISYCQMYYINGENKIKWQSSHKYLSEVVDSNTFIQDYLAVKVSIYNASMAIFKRETFKKVARDFTTFKFSGDRLFWIEVARQGKTHISGKVLNYFRKHDKDVSGKAFKSGLNFIEEIRIINWMYKEQLINDKIYALAFKKQYKEFWKVRKTIDPINKALIKPLFSNPLSSKTNIFKFLPSAIWAAYRHKK
ncbi:glycosyltransferase family 2 protein [Pedobacter caeni]|uniref:Glycosyltransferase involved in cell wall bisynthesis n=1 Tax=Pedobacter caeni TaxID=288992 RepID=A0A1M5D288_9SPHI|nr:glycosyltransferase family 2 protein [Pedobacter caeni]SHF61149.1 Glycosyltransferase involved in cell wall bisynthesis [Pedobacter caeni]